MDKASDFESEDCGFESHLGQVFCISISQLVEQNSWLYHLTGQDENCAQKPRDLYLLIEDRH